MNTQDHILVVDDDTEIRSLLHEYLQKQGYRVTAVADGRGLRAAVATSHPDLNILDLMLPGENVTLCRDLRAKSEVPIIMLTARGDETDRIVDLELGADDYVAKPVSPRELLVRIKSVLRRARSLPDNLKAEASESGVFRFAGWTLDVATRNLTSPQGVVVANSRLSGKHSKRSCWAPTCPVRSSAWRSPSPTGEPGGWASRRWWIGVSVYTANAFAGAASHL